MLYPGHMRVDIQTTVPTAEADRLEAEEKALARELQHAGTWRHPWRHPWRIAGSTPVTASSTLPGTTSPTTS